ncbi:DUF2252 family protein [Sorangium sp. So ce363]|uniref:DUF2252 family protein n=1 Tax=Sorangium sp. So ce363 TaxID=3133304 RepID=UPI003F5DC0F3
MSRPSIPALVTRRGCAAAAFSAIALTAAPGSAASSRTSYVVAEITSANAGLSSSARSEKYAEMKASPFTFFRGSNHLYWKDLGSSPQLVTYGGASSTRTWLGGDMHVNNMGSFDDDQADVVYAANDFDEAVIGDYQLDVWRLAASLALVARENGGYSLADQSSLLDAFTEAYLDAIASYAGNSQETTRKFTASDTYGLLDDFLDDVEASNSRAEMLDDFTIKVGVVRTLDTGGNPDLAPVTAAVDTDVRGHMSAYRATLSGGGAGLPAAYFAVKGVATMTRFTHLAEQWGEILATQHARADEDWDAAVFPDSVDGEIDALTDGDHAGFRAKVRAIALDYADQVALDYASFCASF